MRDIAQAAAEAARVPDFDEILARGRQHRARRHGLAVGATALAVVTIIGVTQLVGGDGGEPPQPAPSPPSTTITDEPRTSADPAAIIDHPDAQIAGAALTSGEDDNWASLWRVVNNRKYWLAITGDAFATRTGVLLPDAADVFAAEGGGFVVRDYLFRKLWITDVDGELRRVTVSGGEAPVSDGEIAVWSARGLLAIDSVTATAHPVDAPEGAFVVREYGGRLTALTGEYAESGGTAAYHWSDDGGATWSQVSFLTGQLGSPEVVLTPAGSDHWVLLLGDGATIGPIMSVLTMATTDDSFTEVAYDGEQASQAGAFVRNGELRMFVDLWGDGSGPPHESGLFRWAGGGLERIATEDPEVTDTQARTLVSADVIEGAEILWVAVDDKLFESADGGITWREMRAR
jgi:hypothetical protein